MTTVVIFHHDFPLKPDGLVGGAEAAVLNFAKRLSKSHAVKIITPGDLGESQFENLTIFGLGSTFDIKKGLEYVSSLGSCVLVCITRGDVLSSSRSVSNIEKRILWLHETDIRRIFSNVDSVNAAADHYIYVSQHQKNYYEEKGLKKDIGSLIYNSCNEEIFYPRDNNRNEHRLCFAGALVEEKGIGLLLDSFKLIQSEIGGAELWFYGSESMWARAPAYDAHTIMNSSKGIRFLGQVPQNYLSSVFSEASLLLAPTLSSKIVEAFGMASIEAQRCGCPALVSASGGLPETVIDRKTGLVINSEDPNVWAESIIQLLKDESRLLTMRNSAISHIADKFSTKRQIDSFTALLN